MAMVLRLATLLRGYRVSVVETSREGSRAGIGVRLSDYDNHGNHQPLREVCL